MRRPDWLPRLARTVRESAPASFAWGRHDCGLFLARCVDAILGTNYALELYSDRRGAARVLHADGGLVGAVTRRLGHPQLEGEPVTGDVCQVGPRALGLFWFGSVLVLGTEGLELRPRAFVKRYWRAG